ncbi:MAG TPA: amidase [Steroidobacteraceae bacterium]|jgi:aspartyl-tRNA(Asn)/glutamyl-tRNA(Gln) amidotransferase subunit A
MSITNDATLAALAADLAGGRRSSRSLVEDCLDRIDDPRGEGARTFLQVDREAARAAADEVDRQRKLGTAVPAHAGIPISVKDLFDIAGQVTRAGSTVLAGQPPARVDAACVARLRRAGFILIGRTNMTEFAFSGLGLNPHYGTPLNPWRRGEQHIPGGSSSGAAISVTDGMAHGALGTDTGGSCRIPAAFTGLVGYKPTASRVPRSGAVPLSTTLDSFGPIARSVDCCARLDAVLAGEPASERPQTGVSGRRFAVPGTVVLDGLDAEVSGAFQQALARLSAAGAQLEQIDVPEFAQIAPMSARGTISNYECYAWHRQLIAQHAAQYDPRVLVRIRKGAAQTADDYAALLAARSSFIAAVEARLLPFDAWLMPTVPIVPPRMSELLADDAYARINGLVLRNPSIVNLLDGCAISIPVHRPGAAPVGLTLACPGGHDAHLFRCAAAAEAVLASK